MLKQRVISAVLAILVLAVAVYYLPTPELRWIVLGIWTLGAWEWSGFLPGINNAKRIVYSICVFIPMLMVALDFFPGVLISAILIVGVLFWISAFFSILRFPFPFSQVFILVTGFCVILPSYSAFDYLLKEQSLWHVFLLLLIIWAADVGAYFSGKRFGKNKLAVNVSPGKTREGALGGLLLSLVVAVTGSKYLLQITWSDSLAFYLIIGVAVVLSSIVGDLTVSMFKRNAGLKDSGVFLPGHGGVLDRVDSLCAGVVFYTMWIILIKPVFMVTGI